MRKNEQASIERSRWGTSRSGRNIKQSLTEKSRGGGGVGATGCVRTSPQKKHWHAKVKDANIRCTRRNKQALNGYGGWVGEGGGGHHETKVRSNHTLTERLLLPGGASRRRLDSKPRFGRGDLTVIANLQHSCLELIITNNKMIHIKGK